MDILVSIDRSAHVGLIKLSGMLLDIQDRLNRKVDLIKVYLVETKGNDKVNDKNVRQKQAATIEWVRKIYSLKPEERMNREWEYVLLSEDNFYGLSSNGATITDICNLNKVLMSQVTGDLFS